MASSVDLVIKVLADTSQAGSAFAGLGGNVGKALGIGATGAAVAGAVAVTTKAAIDFQSAMARVQIAQNQVDFTPGSAKFAAAKAQIVSDSTALASSFSDTADVFAQASRFVDQFGNKLNPDKLQEYTDTMLRLSKVSTDQFSATDAGQQMDVFEKLFNKENFGAVGSAVASLSSVHNQGEGVTFATALPIAQYGAEMGVSQAQALGAATYLADRGAGGQMAGASIGRMFQRMDASADNILDPVESAAAAKRSRAAQERLDDLQSSLAVAEQRQSQMYGQHGLKTTYERDPAAVMASQNEIAKLQREIADAKSDAATAAEGGATARGQMNASAMARVAGMSAEDYAQQIKSDPMTALLAFTRGIDQLPVDKRGAALRSAGITNVRDIKTAETLASEPDVLANYIAQAQGQLDNPTALQSMSDVVLSTTAAKAADLNSMQQAGSATVGEPAREGLDALLDGMLKLGKAAGDDAGPVGVLAGALGAIAPAAGAAVQVLGPLIAYKLLAGSGAAGAAAGTGAASGGIGAGLGAVGSAALGALGAGASAFGLFELNKDVITDGTLGQRVSTLLTGQGANNGMLSAAAPIDAAAQGVVHTGDIIINHPGDIETQAEKYKQDMIALLRTAWSAAQNSTPVPPSIGGNIGGSGPR